MLERFTRGLIPNSWRRRSASAPALETGGYPAVGSDVVNSAQSGERPNDSLKHIARGKQAAEAGDLMAAIACYRAALVNDSANADLRLWLGVALMEQHLRQEARTHLGRAAMLAPHQPFAYYHLGKLAIAEGDVAGGIEHLREALELAPEFEAAHLDLAAILVSAKRRDEAEQTLLTAASACPLAASLHFELGNFYGGGDDSIRAMASYKAALVIDPDFYEAHCNLGVILQGQGATTQAITHFERALEIKPGYLPAHSSLLWLLTFSPVVDGDLYLRQATSFGQKALALVGERAGFECAIDPEPAHRLRVGFVSGDLRNHPVGWFLEGTLKALDHTRFQLFAYSMNPLDDALSERIRGYFAKWTVAGDLDDASLARQIHADGVDVLIDLSGHSGYNRLPMFARKPAPVQLAWLGYLASTGVPGMDYLLADPVSVPESEFHQFTEKIWRLPETIFCFTPPSESPALALTALPAVQNQFVTFACFQRLNKLSDPALRAWGRILSSMPTARLQLRNAGINNQQVRDALHGRLSSAGIDPERVSICGKIDAREAYLASYAEVDLVLDTFPHPGVTTTCEALWMGVPTVTLRGGTMLGRMGASLLTCAGLADWVASSEQEYVDLALRRASDLDSLAKLRAQLREQVRGTPLFDAKQFVPCLEHALLSLWEARTR